MGEAAVDRHISAELFIRQDDHALVPELRVQWVAFPDHICGKIDSSFRGISSICLKWKPESNETFIDAFGEEAEAFQFHRS
jgi:hypothetical protein